MKQPYEFMDSTITAAAPLTFTYHWLYGEHMTRLHDANCFVFWEMNDHKREF